MREIVEGLSTAAGGVPLITINGTPGANYDIFGGFASFVLPGTLDTVTTVAGVAGPVSAPVSSLTALFVPTSGVLGTIPATGTQDLNLAVAVPVGLAGLHLDVQVLVQQPGGALILSNGQVREIVAAPPAGAAWAAGVQYPGSGGFNWSDIEQGDVDGDGDLDTIGVRAASSDLWLTTGGIHVAAGSLGQGGNSGELVDIDNDGFLDLVVVAGGFGGYVRVFLNLGVTAGVWNGFTQLPATDITYTGVCFAADVEAADVDGDGFRDLMLACALAPAVGQQNRLFLNTLPAGVIGFADVTLLNMLTPVLDDTEDCEFLDFDLDGDQDVVFANVDGDTSVFGVGVDYIAVNQGGIQGGALGTFVAAPLGSDEIIDDESLDVAVGDIDADGLPDLYFSNWQATAPSGTGLGTPVRNRLYLNRTIGAAPAFVDFSDALLPDSPAAGGVPTFGTDGEIFDVDFDGDLDIVSGLGTLTGFSLIAVPAVPTSSTGLDVISNPGALTPFPLATIPAALDFDFRDFEHGDWRELPVGMPMVPFGTFFDKDMGCATTSSTLPGQLTTLDHL